MLLKVLGSSSNGNSIVLDSENEALILDAGISSKEVKIALDFNVSKISGVLVSHQHSDHDSYSRDYVKMGIPTIRPFDDEHKVYNLKKGSQFKAKAFALKDIEGNWTHTNGDGTPCEIYGFYITHPSLGSLVYATDTEVIKYKFPGVNHLIIECNYDLEKLEDDGEVKTSHVFRGHHSLQAACKFIEANNSDALKTVILAHLSESNGDPKHFIEEVSKIVSCPVYIAKKGLNINL